MTKDDILGQYNKTRLIRNEISLLIGLMCQKPLDLTASNLMKRIENVGYFLFLIELHLFLTQKSQKEKLGEMILVHVAVEKNIKNVVSISNI